MAGVVRLVVAAGAGEFAEFGGDDDGGLDLGACPRAGGARAVARPADERAGRPPFPTPSGSRYVSTWAAARQLDAQAAAAMAGRLAEELVVRTGVPVPAGAPVGSYLAAVAYERRKSRKVEVVPRGGVEAEVPGSGVGPVTEARDVGSETSPSGWVAGAGRAPPVGRRGPGSCRPCGGGSQVTRGSGSAESPGPRVRCRGRSGSHRLRGGQCAVPRFRRRRRGIRPR